MLQVRMPPTVGRARLHGQCMCDMQDGSVMALRRVLVLLMAGALLAACSAAPSKDIKATLEEWKMTLSPSVGAAGEVTFTIKNNGEKEHEFVVVKTDLAADKLPTVASGADAGTVDEEAEKAAGIEALGEKEKIQAGTDNNVLKLTLTPGHYVIFCNIHAEDLVHYQKGMHTEFTVS
jgi:uncharacterized cupredoxin-like copper-binding protein